VKIRLSTNHPADTPTKRTYTGELNRTRYASVSGRYFRICGATGSWMIEEIAPYWIDKPMIDPRVGDEYVGICGRLNEVAPIIERHLEKWPTESQDEHYARLRRFAAEVMERERLRVSASRGGDTA